MHPGQVIAGRFVINAITRPGDVTEVAQARDRASGELVALKVLLQGRARDHARFEREARALSELRHPGIVRYVHHGVTPSGEPYLATEWLEGEDLERRLSRDRLEIAEALAVISQAAEALSVAHARGVIHRDLKPSNLFLVEGKLDQVKLLDFGMARFRGGMRMTQTGTLLGSPGYMAPEQARGELELSPRVDVFALGCVLFECLTGEPAFGNEHLMGLLGNLLFDEPPRVIGFRPDVPESLDALVAQMLSKDPQQRPRDGAAVLEAVEALEQRISVVPCEPPASIPYRSLSGAERRLMAVLLIGPEPRRPGGAPAPEPPALGEGNEPIPVGDALRYEVQAREGRLVVLRDGSLRATMPGAGVATDHAAHAARTALALRAIAPERKIALSMNLTEVSGPRAMTEAIYRAESWIATRGWTPAPRDTPPVPPIRPIAIEEPVGALLDASFEIVEGPGRLDLYAERVPQDEGTMRPLLGKPSIAVGRERELGVLRGLLEECIEESIAHAVLLTAAAGIGKSRLMQQLVREIRNGPTPIEIWIGRCDSLRVGPTKSLLGHLLRNTCSILEGESLEVRRQKLRRRVGRHVPAADQQWVSEFLAELAGLPSSGDASSTIEQARHDRQRMDDQIQKAWETLLRSECESHPVLLIFENLHGADLQTVRVMDEALRNLHHHPWMLLALARPEVHDIFPKLWTDRGIQEIRLGHLSRKAGERLVRHALGDSASAQTIQRIVTQAGGHPFSLEQLMIAEAAGQGAVRPETVLWIAQAKLAGLEREARQMVRAASIFGEVFWQGAVAALLGGGLRYMQMGHWFTELVSREVLVHRPESRFPNEQEFAFQTPVLRDAVYATLTRDDRVLGHQLAAEWLQKHGENDPLVIELHLERGRETESE